MNRKRKIIGALFVLMLVVVMMAACSSNQEKPNPSNEPNKEQVKETNDGNTDANKEEGPKRKISILTTSSSDYTQMVTDWNSDVYVKKLEELTGYDLDFEFLSWNDNLTQLTVRFASGALADLIRTTSITSPAHANAVENNAIHDLTDLIDQYGPNLKAKIPETVWRDPRVSQDGRIYAIPALVPNANTEALYIRKDWLEKAEMDMPVTLDDWLAYFEKVKTMDMNGNGDPNDEYGFYVRENLASSDMFFYEFGVKANYWVMNDGQFVPSVITDNMKEVLKFWRNLYQKGYINPDAFTKKSADWFAGIQSGEAGSWLHYVDNITDSWNNTLFIDQPDAEPHIVEPPKGPVAQGLGSLGAGIYFVWIIPSNVKNPEEIIQFLDKTWADEEIIKFNALGIEGRNYTETDGKINWDPQGENNGPNGESTAYQINMNMTGHSLNNPQAIELNPYADQLKRGFEIAKSHTFMNEAMYMPAPEVFKTRPELQPNFSGGATLLLDMFAKVVTGNGDIDAEFNKFVEEWKSRGGNEAIKQATEWYNEFYKK